MKTLITSLALLVIGASSHAATTIDASNSFAYGANIGWINWRGDVTNGAVIGEYVCSGYIYAANVGWIHLGNGSPSNGIRYGNGSGNDFGINHDGFGGLRGLAYGANIGWINFENTGNPHVDLSTGILIGFAWSANCGWISLGDLTAFVKTNSIQMGRDTDTDGIADAFELFYAGNLVTLTANSDVDADGASDAAEYVADTNPFDGADALRITSFTGNVDGSVATVTWTSRPTRVYRIEKRTSLTLAPAWIDSGLGLITPTGASTTRALSDSPGARFYRVEAVRPLAP